MIVGQIFAGSGIGNQLHRYIMTRVLAKELGVDFGFEGIVNFKGNSFLNLEWGKIPVWDKEFIEKKIVNDQGVDIRGIDTSINFIQNSTRIDGEFQDERYWEKHRENVDKWLKVEPMNLGNICVINLRGGEYKIFPDLYLTKKYWNEAIKIKRQQGVKGFVVVTDDIEEAEKFFPEFIISHEIGRDWRAIRYAKHLILSNSSFAILPAWLGQGDIIAPKNWARHNIGIQSTRQNIYKNWNYI